MDLYLAGICEGIHRRLTISNAVEAIEEYLEQRILYL